MIETHNEILLELHYLSDFKNAKILRDFLEELLVQMKIPAQTVSRFILAGDELNNNAIEYGSAAGELNKMRVIVKKVEKTYSIQLEVEDTGTGEKSKTADEMRKKQKDVLEK
jgi:anti-sigma regulatory factor (Ser/Thr protein kinase)